MVLFPIGFVLLWWGSQAALLHGLRSYNTGTLGVWNKVMDGKVNAEILLAGSSRTWVHMDPTVIQSVAGKTTFNAGRDGTLPDLQLAFLKTYLRHNGRPALLVQGLDITMLRRTTNVYNPGQYAAYLAEPDLYLSLSAVNSAFRLYRWLPLVGILKTHTLGTAVRGLLHMFPKENLVFGYKPQDISWRDDFERFKATHPSGNTVAVDADAKLALREILKLCKDEGITVVLVYSPELRENQRFTVNRTNVFEEFRALAGEYSSPFWDYSNDPLCDNKSFFYNSQHLNRTGATIFSQELGTRLRDLLNKTNTTASSG